MASSLACYTDTALMSLEECEHKLIERPKGIPGYRPAMWCAVCGRAADPKHDLNCNEANCPNLCHVSCMNDGSYYNCKNTAQLRERICISDQVVYTNFISKKNTQPSPPQQPRVPEDHDNLPCGCGKVIKRLTAELAASKAQNSEYSMVIDELPDTRSVLVKALSIVDTLISLRINDANKFEQTSVSCTAKEGKIEKAWADHIERNQDARRWWATVSHGARGSEPTSDTLQASHHINNKNISQLPDPHHQPDNPTDPPPTSSQPTDPPPASSQPTDPPPTSSQPTDPTDSTDPPPTSNQMTVSLPMHQRRRGKRQGGFHSFHNPRPTQPLSVQEGSGASPNHTTSTLGGESTKDNRRRSSRTMTSRSQHHHDGRSRENQQQRRLLFCDYCQGRYHTSKTCRERQADRRHQDLIEAVRQGSQDTLAVLRGASFPVQQHTQTYNSPWGVKNNAGNPHYVLGEGYPMASQFGFSYPFHHRQHEQMRRF